jgi:hypothetical protein
MNIVKTVIEPVRKKADVYFVLSVAIESRPGCWKGYWMTFENYPTQSDVERVANVGIKITDSWRAELTFGAMPSMEFEY